MDLLRTLCERLAARLPVQRISGHDGSTYLERYTLLNLGPTRGRVYLHRFLRGDEDRELHNHPWYAISLILVAGYLEERRRWTPEGHTLASAQAVLPPAAQRRRLHALVRPFPASTLIAANERGCSGKTT